MNARSLTPWLLLSIAIGCGGTEESPTLSQQQGPLSAAFAASAREANVATSLLYAIATIEDGLDEPMVRDVEPEVEIPQAGPLHLRHGAFDSLAEAAALTQTTELALRQDTALALRAGAALLVRTLRAHGAELPEGADESSVDWARVKDALAEWSGYSDRYHQYDYATRVLGVLARGGSVQNYFGESLYFAPMSVPTALLIPEPKPLGLAYFDAQFPGAEVLPIPRSKTNKYLAGHDGWAIDTLIIHDTEGGWEGSAATLQNQGSASAHYMVGKDGRLAQFLPEEDTAYHCGNRIYNRRSIGIEHVGKAVEPFPEALYAKSAELVGHLAAKYNVPLDRAHIIGHDQVPSSTRPQQIAVDAPPCDKSPAQCQATIYYGGASHHTDPGIWQWGPYMARMKGTAKCNDLPTALTCDSTGNFRMGCIDGVVQVDRCITGCVPVEGEAPFCEQPPEQPEEPHGPTEPTDPFWTPPKGGADDTPGRTGQLVDSPPPKRNGASQFELHAEASGGCSSAGHTPASGVLIALALLATRRRRAL